jgi:hypothetical protein
MQRIKVRSQDHAIVARSSISSGSGSNNTDSSGGGTTSNVRRH